jgi:HEAT repeat protein
MPVNAESSTPSDVAAASADAAEASTAFEGGLDPRSIVVFRRPEAVADTAELAEAAKCHDAIIEQLQAIVGLNVIAGTRVSSFDGSNLDDWEVARALGAGNLLHLSTENGCNARLHHARSSDPWESRITGLTFGGRYPAADGWLGFALTVADNVRESLLANPATRIIEAQASVLNVALSDRQRIHALQELQDSGQPGAFESGVVAAAAQLAISSSDSDAREAAWVYLRGVDDQLLVAPLLQALATDADEDVRMQAALTLRTFVDEPGVREALLRAAAEDPASEPYVTCCVPTVREAAEWASVATQDLPALARGKLLDENLPTRSRLYWLGAGMPDGRSVRISDLGDDVQPIVFEIGRNETDPILRRMAWRALDGANHPEVVPVLLDDLRNHPDEYVRASAGFALSPYIDLPEVLAAIEAAVNDPSMEVRRMAGNQIARTGR